MDAGPNTHQQRETQMSKRALLLAIAACFAVAACDTKKDEPPKPKTAQAVVPLPPEAPKAAAASGGQDATPIQVAQAADTQKAGTRKGCGGGRRGGKNTLDDSGTPRQVTHSNHALSGSGPNNIRST